MKSGIYCIKNVINGKFYIGSSKNIAQRFSNHKMALKKKTHGNRYMQNAWEKYGEDAFTCTVLEYCECDKKILLEREKHFIDTMKPEYNIRKEPSSNLGVKHPFRKRTPLSVETKEKIAASKRGKPRPEHVKNKLKIAHTGKKLSEDHKQKLSEKMSVRIFTDVHRKRISDSKKGNPLDKNTLKKSADLRRGKPLSEEHKKKISETMIRILKGYPKNV